MGYGCVCVCVQALNTECSSHGVLKQTQPGCPTLRDQRAFVFVRAVFACVCDLHPTMRAFWSSKFRASAKQTHFFLNVWLLHLFSVLDTVPGPYFLTTRPDSPVKAKYETGLRCSHSLFQMKSFLLLKHTKKTFSSERDAFPLL